MSGCNYLEGGTDRVGSIEAPSENSILLCTDGLDNDKNGLVDCEDPGCKQMGTALSPGPGATVCAGVIGDNTTENNIYVCSDGKDNDGDGFVDCNDNSCKQTAACCVSPMPENTAEACSDGIDNDCDGYADCQDYSCKGGNSKDTQATPEAIEYCRSVNCPIVGDENTLEACSDGIDNDCDGYADCKDRSCNGGNSKDTQATQEAIDYCKSITCPYAPTAEDTWETCFDGIDNDCNGYTDCADFSCAKNTTNPGIATMCANSPSTEEGLYMGHPENTEAACSDGQDNNYNGLIDCADGDCKAMAYCQGATDEPPARAKGFADLPFEQKREQIIKEHAACTDGVDNDKDSLIDCQEYQCHLLSLQQLTGDLAPYQINCK